MCIRDSIFTERNGIYIIDLQKTVKKLDEAYNYVKEVAAEGGDIPVSYTHLDVYKRQDVPCSGLGILAKKPDLRYKKLEPAREAELLLSLIHI